jgi:hypothetical protein
MFDIERRATENDSCRGGDRPIPFLRTSERHYKTNPLSKKRVSAAPLLLRNACANFSE